MQTGRETDGHCPLVHAIGWVGSPFATTDWLAAMGSFAFEAATVAAVGLCPALLTHFPDQGDVRGTGIANRLEGGKMV